MEWIILFCVVLGTVLLAWVFTRTTSLGRRRSAQWNDLHARGRLITAQLTRFREREARCAAQSTRRVPHLKSAKKSGFSWRRRVSVPRDVGPTPSDPHAAP